MPRNRARGKPHVCYYDADSEVVELWRRGSVMFGPWERSNIVWMKLQMLDAQKETR